MMQDKLAMYIKECFDYWRQERMNLLEDTWSFAYDAFKGEYSSGNIARWKKLEGHEWRSKFFVRLTKQKVVAVVSQIEDVEFQGGKLPWDISPTPYPQDMAGQLLDPQMADDRCEAMKRIMDDNLTETDAETVFIQSLLEMAVYGLSWLRAPVLREVTAATVSLESPVPGIMLPPELLAQYGKHQVNFIKRVIPTVEHPNLWDMFWDLETADHQKGQGIIHRQMMSPGRFLQLSDRPGYDKEAIDRVFGQAGPIDQSIGGTVDSSEGPYRSRLQYRRRNMPVFEFYGRVPRRYLVDSQMDLSNVASGSREVEIACVVAGTGQPRTIKGPFTADSVSAIRPFHLARWEEIPGEPGGVGIAENLKDSQAMLNSAVRCFIDNKALASNLLIFGKSNALAPGQDKTIYSGKFFELANHVMDWREAMGFAQVPDVSAGLVDLINMVERFADEDSNAPKLLQGETARFSPNTAFETGQLLEAANKALGKIIRNRERGHYEPVIKGLYWWEMATNPDENLKGDYTVKATGYSTYLNKIQRGKVLSTLLTMALSNPMLAMLINPEVHLEEIYKASDLDPDAGAADGSTTRTSSRHGAARAEWSTG